MIFILSLLSVLFLQGLLVSYNFNLAVGETFHIVTSLETPCPGEFSGVPCLTLQQYVSNPSISSGNVTLLFETGNHILGTAFSASSAMKYSLSGDNVNIECISTIARLNFVSIQEVDVSGINFWRCNGGINFTNVVSVTITSSTVQYSHGYTTHTPPVILTHVGVCNVYDSTLSHNSNSYRGVMTVTNTTLNIYNSVFHNNARNGGVIYATDVSSGRQYYRIYTNITILNSIFMNNRLPYYSNGRGGVIYVYDNQYTYYPIIIGLTIKNCTFNNNNAYSYGAVLYYNGGYEVTIMNSKFRGNAVSQSDSKGGAVYSTSPITIYQSNFSYNRAGQQGGAIYSSSGLQCVQSTFTNNSATNGGAVFVNQASFFINCDFRYNTANHYGGGIHITGTNSSLSVLQSSFTGNTATTLGGGAIYSNSRYSNISISESTYSYNFASYCSVLDVDEFYHSNVSITESVFTNNMATGGLLGGGVACIRNASVYIHRSTFQHNQAALHGGVFHIDESNTFIDESLFVNNSASVDGGVFYTYVHPSYYDIRRSEFSYNSAGDDGGVMFIGRVNSRVNISECVFSFNNASDRGGVAALIGSLMFLDLNKSDIFNNTAEYGGIISACNSVVMVMEGSLFQTTDPVYSFCTLYDGHIVHYHISPPVSTQLTPSLSTSLQIMSMTSSLGTRIRTTQRQNRVTSRAILRTSEHSTKFTTRLYPTHTTVLSTAISTTEINKLTLSPIVALSSTPSHSSVTVTPTKSFLFSSQERIFSSTTSSGMPNTNYLTVFEPEATTNNSPSSPTVSNSVLKTYVKLSSSLSEIVTSLATMITEQVPTTSQSLFVNSVYTEFSVKASLTTLNTDGTHSYSDTISSSKLTKQLVKPTQIAKSSVQPFVIVYQNTIVPPTKEDVDKGSVNSDINIKLNTLMAMSAVFLAAIVTMGVVLAGIIVKLYKTRPSKPITISTCNEEENPLLEYESTETEMKDNFY